MFYNIVTDLKSYDFPNDNVVFTKSTTKRLEYNFFILQRNSFKFGVGFCYYRQINLPRRSKKVPDLNSVKDFRWPTDLITCLSFSKVHKNGKFWKSESHFFNRYLDNSTYQMATHFRKYYRKSGLNQKKRVSLTSWFLEIF